MLKMTMVELKKKLSNVENTGKIFTLNLNCSISNGSVKHGVKKLYL
jgi:hypothetical protein